MTEERERAVERLTYPDLGYDFEGDLMGWLVDKDDLRALLSERAELLATVERMRGALELAVDLVDRDVIRVRPSERSEFLDALGKWNAALTTGEDK
jgi:hypothetical protein